MPPRKYFRASTFAVAVAVTYGISAGSAMAAASPQKVQGPYPLASYSSINWSAPPAVAANAAGRFVLAWQPNIVSRGQYGPASVQLFADPQTPVGAAIPIGKQAFGNVAVAMDKDGDFAVAWREGTVLKGPDWRDYGAPYPATSGTIYVQRYSSSGTALGAAQTVGPAYDGLVRAHGSYPNWSGNTEIATPLQVAMDDDGDVVVGWSEVAQGAGYGWYTGSYDSSSIVTKVEVFGRDGSATTPVVVTNEAKSAGEIWNIYGFANVDADVLAGIAMNGTGQLALLYNSYRKGVPQAPIVDYRGLDLTSSGSPFSLGAVTSKTIGSDLFGMDSSGNLAVGWTASDGIRIGHYTPAGVQQGSIIGPLGKGSKSCASTLSVTPSGNLAITWGVLRQVDLFGTGTPQNSCARAGQWLNADGTTHGTPMVVESGTDELNGADATAAVDGLGSIITVWSATRTDHSTELMGAVVKSQ